MGGEGSGGRSCSRNTVGCYQKVRVRPSHENGLTQCTCFHRARLATRRQFTIDSLDIFLPAASIGLVHMNEGLLGLLGYVCGLLFNGFLLNLSRLPQSCVFDPRCTKSVEIGAWGLRNSLMLYVEIWGKGDGCFLQCDYLYFLSYFQGLYYSFTYRKPMRKSIASIAPSTNGARVKEKDEVM